MAYRYSPGMNTAYVQPETAMLRRQVLNRAALGTSGLTSTLALPKMFAEKPEALVAAKTAKKLNPVTEETQARVALDAREPIMVWLSEKELEHCRTWEEMAAVLGLKGVPSDRLDNKPDIRADEKDGGIMLEIL